MKKMLFAALCAVCLSSCYNTKILVGDVQPKEPLVKVNSEWNHHLIFGLVPLDNATMVAKDYLSGQENYVVKTNESFLNMFVSWLTCCIYTPTQTVYYVPLRDVKGAQ